MDDENQKPRIGKWTRKWWRRRNTGKWKTKKGNWERKNARNKL